MNRLLCAAAALAVVAGGAQAATVKAKYTGVGDAVGNAFGLKLVHTQGTSNYNVRAGSLIHQVQASSETFAGQSLRTFCIDLAQTVNGSVNTYTIKKVDAAPDPDAPTGNVGEIRAGFLQSLYANAIDAGLLDRRGSWIGDDDKQASAFQLVVWELAFEDAGILDTARGGVMPINSLLTQDNFKVTSNLNTVASSDIEQFFQWAFEGRTLAGLRAMTSMTAQDQLIVVPLPTGGALALAGLAGVAIRRRR